MNYHLFYVAVFFAALGLTLGQWRNNNNAKHITPDDVPFVAGVLAFIFMVAAIVSIWA